MPKPPPEAVAIFKKAIGQALDNGWDKDGVQAVFSLYTPEELLSHNRYYQIIFDQGFARAFWGYGNDYHCIYCGNEMWLIHPQPCPFAGFPPMTVKPLWQYHLQQIAIADDKLKYLEQCLPKA